MKWPTFVQIRTGVLFTFGLAGVVYETVVVQADRPTLLILFGAMLGLPLFLKADEKSTDAELTKVIDAATKAIEDGKNDNEQT